MEKITTIKIASLISQDRLKELFYYDPDTGDFKHKAKRRGVSNIDDPVGSIDNGYLRIRVDNKLERAHRLAWLYENGSIDDSKVIDHIDHNGLKNAMSNLREVDRSTNSKNLSKSVNNISGVSGVYKDRGKWRSKITSNGKNKYLGTFDEYTEAVLAREQALMIEGFHPNHGN